MKTVIPDIQQGMNVVGTDGRKIGTVAALYGGTPDRTGRTGEVDVTESGARLQAEEPLLEGAHRPDSAGAMGPVAASTIENVSAATGIDLSARGSGGPGYLEVEQGGIMSLGARHLYVPYAAILNVTPGEAVEVDCHHDECLDRFGEKPDWLD